MSEDSDSTPAYGAYDREADHAFPDEQLHAILTAVDDDREIQAYLAAQNVNPVTRHGYNDHGPKHIQIVLDRALALYDLLKRAGVECNGAADHDLPTETEPVIVALGATLHDIGHVVHRDNHSHWSVPLAADILDRLLLNFFNEPTAIRLKGEILHAVICHHADQNPMTREAGIVRVADGLDMERGRSREPYESGGRGINTVSSQAIRGVHLYEGESVPVRIEIEMTDAAGVYQVDGLLKAKLEGTGLEDLLRIVAVNVGSDEAALVERIEL